MSTHLATAATSSWLGSGGTDNWSDAANWTGGVPDSTSDVVFIDDDASGSQGPSGSPNNVVAASRAIQSLAYRNTNGFHTTQIPSGSTLTVTGAVSSPLFVGTGTDAGLAQTVYATILGYGTLFVTNNSGVLNVRQGSATAGSHRATLDLSGLDTFAVYASRLLVGGDGTSTAAQQRPAATLYLAKTNFIVLSAAVGTAGLVVGDASSNGGGNNTAYLGQTNTFWWDSGITIGGRKSTGNLMFDPAVWGGSVTFRNRVGTGRQNLWLIGDNATSGSSSSNAGTVDLSAGTVDALVETIYVGRGQTATGTRAGVGTLTIAAGSVDANTVEIGYQTAVDASPGTGTVNVNDTAQLTVNGNLRLGRYLGITNTPSKGTLNIGGTGSAVVTVKGDIIDGGGTGSSINVSSGTLKVGGKLGNNLGATNQPLNALSLSTAVLVFDLGSASNPTLPPCNVSNLTVFAATLNLLGSGLTVGQFPLIKYYSGVLEGGGFDAVSLGTLPASMEGYLSNNFANSTIDVVITNIATPKWNGNVNGDWDINLTANWKTLSGGKATTYHESAIPGEQVLFDDSASGTTTVNLTTTLSPNGINVVNSTKTYTFTGSGRLSGPTGLNKSGSGDLILSNSGSNDFAGSVAVNGGRLLLAGSADRLPASAAVTLADVAGVALDLNSLNQTLGVVSGGGAAGGSLSLGSATLTLGTGSGTHSGTISGSGGIVKAGTGTQVLGGNNSYAGGTRITAGALAVANAAGSGTGSGSVTIETNAVFALGAGGVGGSSAAATLTNNGTVSFNRADDFTLANVITGGGTVRKDNTNTVLIPFSNSYTGVTTIANGALRVSHPSALGDLSNWTHIDNPPAARLELLGDITLAEPIELMQKQSAAAQAPSIVNVSGTNTLAGAISATTGGSDWTFRSDAGKLRVTGPFNLGATMTGTRNLRLRGAGDGEWLTSLNANAGGALIPLYKDGAGTWILGATNTYNGVTTVSEGSLIVDGSLLGTTGVVVNGGTLGGSGLIAAPVTINANGTLAPGNSLGTLTITGALALNGTCVVDVSHSAANKVAGLASVALGGTLKITLAGALQGGEAFQLFEAGAYTGDFSAYDLPALTAPLSWDTTQVPVNGTLRVAGSAPQPPRIGSITLSGTNLVVSGSGGTPGGTYYVLTAPGLTVPLSIWTPVLTNVFDASGNFIFTNVITPNVPAGFYRLQLP